MTGRNKTALITGASGFIGSRLCELLAAEYQIHILLRSNSMALLSANQALKVFKADLPDSEGLAAACEAVDIIFHTAGIAHTGNVTGDEYQRVNVEGTGTLIDAAKQAGVKKLVFFSSILAAGPEHGTNFSDYAKSKKDAEDLLSAEAADQFQCTILRPVNVYGPGMKGNIAGLIRRIKSGDLPPLPKLENELPLISVHDLCEAAILAAESDQANGKIYALSDGESYTPNTLENSIYEALGRKKPTWRSPRMVFYAASLAAQIANSTGLWKNDLGLRTYCNLTGQISTNIAAGSDISADLGFQPQHSFQSELPDILRAIEKEPKKESKQKRRARACPRQNSKTL